MPTKKKKADKPLPANQQKGSKICSCCGKNKKLTEYYLSYNPMYSVDQRVPICKSCCKEKSLNSDGTINYPQFKEVLKNIGKPLFYDSLWSSFETVKRENSYLSEEEVELHGEDIIARYFRNVAMRQDRAISFSDSEKDEFMHQNNNRTSEEKNKIIQKYEPLFGITTSTNSNKPTDTQEIIRPPRPKEEVVYNTDAEFEVTDKMIELFGDGYTPSLYKKMFDKYEKLKMNYSLQTNIHQEALATYVRFKVQEEIETSKGNVTEAKKWYDAAQSAAQDAKLTPKQLTKADLDSGINSISELTKALEQAVDVIKILPRFKYRPNDAPDFNIWCYVNYERKLNDQPDATYEDVYQFYDKRKREYIEQNGDPYGIFINDTTEKNRDTVKTFIKLPDDYEDLAGDDDESN